MIDAVVDDAVAREKIVGAVIIVARGGEIIYHRAAGFADREAGIPVRCDTLFRFASLTKLAVSAAAFALVERGDVAIDDPVTKWLPDFRPALPEGTVPPITLEQLLTHTSGLSYGWNEAADSAYHRMNVSDGVDQPGLSIEENLRRIAAVPLLFQPGTQFAYSIGTDVAAEALARAAGVGLDDLLRRTVLEPLDMHDTAFHPVDRARLAVPYADAQPPVRMEERFHVVPFAVSGLRFSPARAFDRNSYPSGGTGLIGTAKDFLKLLEAIRTGGRPILSAASADAIVRRAMGISVEADGSWGWGGIYGNNYWVDPKRAVSAVILTNTTIAGMTGDFPDAVRAAVAEVTA